MSTPFSAYTIQMHVRVYHFRTHVNLSTRLSNFRIQKY